MYVILAKERANSVLFMPAAIIYESKEIADIVAKHLAERYWETQVHQLTFISYCNNNVLH